jgi:hypothetical protein
MNLDFFIGAVLFPDGCFFIVVMIKNAQQIKIVSRYNKTGALIGDILFSINNFNLNKGRIDEVTR